MDAETTPSLAGGARYAAPLPQRDAAPLGAVRPTLSEARFIALTTFRRNGAGVATPVLFVSQADDRLLVRTAADSGKVKRIRSNPAVEVAPCDSRGGALGPSVVGTARILGPEAVGAAVSMLHARYRVAGPLFTLVRRLRRQPSTIVEIRLVEA